MAIEHKNIPEDGLHEPKGISIASASRVYKSDGAGSGSWVQVDSDTLKGTINNASAADLRVVTDGSGGFKTQPTPASSFGTMNLTDNATTKAVTAATDTTLNTNTDFVEFDLSMEFDSLQGITAGPNYLTIDQSGLYLVDLWASVKSSVNATKFSLKFVLNDTTFVTRGPKLTLGSLGQIYNMSANGIHTFAANDQVKLYIAADKSANITIEDMTFQLVYLGGV